MRSTVSAKVEQLLTYPIKSFDGRSVDAVEIVTNGGLAGDREFALFDDDGDYVNGKHDKQVHPIRASYNGETARAESVTLSTPEQEPRQFDLGAVDDDAAALTDWLSEWFGYPVSLTRNREGGFPDDTTAAGPTIISQATVDTVAGFDQTSFSAGCRRSGRITSSPTATAACGSRLAMSIFSALIPVSGVSSRAVTPIPAIRSRDSTSGLSKNAGRRCRRGAAVAGSTTTFG